jgi:hypothetical protein
MTRNDFAPMFRRGDNDQQVDERFASDGDERSAAGDVISTSGLIKVLASSATGLSARYVATHEVKAVHVVTGATHTDRLSSSWSPAMGHCDCAALDMSRRSALATSGRSGAGWRVTWVSRSGQTATPDS